jgi:RNA-directed DNA polymerase
MHQSIPAQGKWLQQVVRGYFNYYAVPTNRRAIAAFRDGIVRGWRRALRRRSQKDDLTRERIKALADAWLPKPKILHLWPRQRFAVIHPRWEPYAGKPHLRFCAAGAQQ